MAEAMELKEKFLLRTLRNSRRQGELPDGRGMGELETFVQGGDAAPAGRIQIRPADCPAGRIQIRPTDRIKRLDGSYGQCFAVRRQGGKVIEIADLQTPSSYSVHPEERV